MFAEKSFVVEFSSAPRPVPRTVSCFIYSVMSVVVIAAVLVTLISNSRNQRRKIEDGSIDFRKHGTETTTPVYQLFSPAVIRYNEKSKKPRGEDYGGLIKLEEVVGYECHQTGNKNYNWVEGSDHEVFFLDATGHRWPINIDNGTVLPGPSQDHLRRHLSAIWRCSSDSCRLNIRTSSAQKASPLKFGNSLIREIARLAQGRPADFVFLRTLAKGLHKRKLSVWLTPADNETSNATNSCTRKLFKEYGVEWDDKFLRPKFQCRKRVEAISLPEKMNSLQSSTNESGVSGACYRSCEGSDNRSSQTKRTGFWQDWSEKSTNSRKRRSLDENDSFEYLRLGESNWVLHTVIQRVRSSSVLSLAVSELEVVLQDLRPDWIPVADDKRYRTVVNDYLYVTRVLGMTTSVNQATVFFVAAPVHNFSRRYLYKIKIIHYNNFVNFGPSVCLTCMEINEATNVLGMPPQCGWTEARMSYTGSNYILNCKGPGPPWTSVVSTKENLVIHQLQKSNHSHSKPTRVYFEVRLKGNFRARARLHLPRKCNGRLLLGLSDQQTVTDRYDLTLADYLASAKDYAVLHADVRGSRFMNLDIPRVRFGRRVMMQVQDYARVARRAVELAEGCVRDDFLGVYGGQVALGVLRTKGFRCGVFVKPAGSSKTGDMVPGNKARRRHLLDLVPRLRDKKFALYSFEPSDELLELSTRLRVNFTHRVFEDDNKCTGKFKLYQEMIDFFDKCFGS